MLAVFDFGEGLYEYVETFLRSQTSSEDKSYLSGFFPCRRLYVFRRGYGVMHHVELLVVDCRIS